MTARTWPATTTRHHRPPTGPWLPRTDWLGLAACLSFAVTYLRRARGARR